MNHKDYHLTCRTDVGPYLKGQHIEGAAEVEAILASEHRHHFAKVVADNPKEPEPEANNVDAMLAEATAQ